MQLQFNGDGREKERAAYLVAIHDIKKRAITYDKEGDNQQNGEGG